MPDVTVAIIGSGFGGIGMAASLARAGITDVVLLERAAEVGGTWRDNSYPGAACDVPSHLYSFSFAPNPDWSRSFSPQPEIWKYLRQVAAATGSPERSGSARRSPAPAGTRLLACGASRPPGAR